MKRIVSFILCLAIILGSLPVLNHSLKAAQNEWNFNYTGGIQEWTAPYSGKYKIVLKGASGGTSNALKNGVPNEVPASSGGEGGVSVVEIAVIKGQKYYIGVGGQGTSGTNAPGGYNGGGQASGSAGSGGGATHIATTPGTLAEAIANESSIVAVAGGGGGSAGDYLWITSGPAYKTEQTITLPYRMPILGIASSGGETIAGRMKRATLDGAYMGVFTPGTYPNYDWAHSYYENFQQNYLVLKNGYNVEDVIGGSFSDGYKKGLGEPGKNGSGGAGAGWYGGKSGHEYYDGAAGGSSMSKDDCLKSTHSIGGNIGNGSVQITYEGKISTKVNINLEGYATYNGKTDVSLDAYYGEELTLPAFTLNSGKRIDYFKEIIKGGIYSNDKFVVDALNLNLKAFGTAELKVTATNVNGAVRIRVSENDERNKKYVIYQWRSDLGWHYANFETAIHKNPKSLVMNYGPTGSNKGYTVPASAFYYLEAASGKAGRTIDNGYYYGGNGGAFSGYIPLLKNDYITSTVGCNGGDAVGDMNGWYEYDIDIPGNNGWPLSGKGGVDTGDGNQVEGGIGGPTTVTSRNLGELAYISGGSFSISFNGHFQYPISGEVKRNHSTFSYPSKTSGVSTSGYSKLYNIGSIFIDNDYFDNIYINDFAAPNRPKNGKYEYADGNKFKITWQDNGDNGTQYKYYAESYDKSTEALIDTSATINYEHISGVKGFYYYIDTIASGTATTSHTFVTQGNITINVPSQKSYIHVAAIDKAGNLGPTYTFEIPSIAKYTVKHYAQNEDGTYTLVETEEFTDTIGKTVKPAIHPQTGRDNPPVQSVVITADGKATVNYYYDVTRFDINGTVQWNDHNNIYGTRPEDIKVTLYRDGEYFDEVIVSAANNSNGYSFPAVQKYDLNTGREFVYTVSQETAYSQAALATSEDKYLTRQIGFNFLNTINNTNADKPERPNPDKPDDKGFFVEGNIYWDDNNDSLGFRPSEVTITLYQKGEDGEFKVFDSVIVDANTENHYLFDWLPKYWYDTSGVPTKYEYKVEETFTSWYVENGVIKDAYEIHPDTPKDCDFTNVFEFPSGPIIPVNEYANTLTVVTNTEEEVRIILKPEELIINPDYSVSYGAPTGEEIPTLADNKGSILTDLPSTRYEIIVDSPEYTVDDMNLTLPENMKLEKVGDKWYLIIENQPADAIGTLEIELSKKEVYYQDRCRINNYFACPNKNLGKAVMINAMSLFSITVDEMPDAEITDDEITDSEITDSEVINTDSEVEAEDTSEVTLDDLESSEDVIETTEEISEGSDGEITIEDLEGSSTAQAEDVE